jgi:hypothetical protein
MARVLSTAVNTMRSLAEGSGVARLASYADGLPLPFTLPAARAE